MVALIPARGGSKRIPRKNVKDFHGYPLLAYSIQAARDSGVCGDGIYVSTEDDEIASEARHWGADVIKRPRGMAEDSSRDYEWVRHAVEGVPHHGGYVLLRPTSPFRKGATIRRAAAEFTESSFFHSLRAVSPCREHPAKQWQVFGQTLVPLFGESLVTQACSSPTQNLPLVWTQNASLEIFWRETVMELWCITGHRVQAFRTSEEEGFDINDEQDWWWGLRQADLKHWTLPEPKHV